jgi:3-oxoadipate enol-lactonase
VSILLVHGVGGRPRSWNRVLAELEPELRGQSVAVDVTVAAEQSVSDVADDVVRRHPGSHVIVGHSFGGMLAQEIALADPALVRGLVLVSTIPGATPRVSEINRAMANDVEARGLENFADGFAAALFSPGRLDAEPHLGAEFVADLLDAGAKSVCAALRAVANWDASERLPAIRCPVIVVSGDAEADLDRQQLLAQLIRARFEVLEDTGHLALWEAPGRVARAITEMAGATR